MKMECWACGNYARMPLSFRHWCQDCESDYAEVSRRFTLKRNDENQESSA